MHRLQRQFQVFIRTSAGESRSYLNQSIEVVMDSGHIPLVLTRPLIDDEPEHRLIDRAIASCDVYVLVLDEVKTPRTSNDKVNIEREQAVAREFGLVQATVILTSETTSRSENPRLSTYSASSGADTRSHSFQCGPTDQFKYVLLRAIDSALADCEQTGLVRIPTSATFDLLSSASDNEFVYDTVTQLQAFSSLYKRCSYRADEKRALARFFREQYIDIIMRNQVSLFFESGATIAHVARELADPLARNVFIEEGGRPNIQISTNNVLAYLQFWLISRVPCTTFPWGPPSEETYGASYGGLEKIEARRPTYDNEPLDETAKREIERLLSAPFTLTFRSPTLLFGAVSGLQIGPHYETRYKVDLDEESRQTLDKRLEQCAGPHVNSYHNKVFKRFMYATGLPIVICLTADKIDCDIAIGDSHFILDREVPWSDFYRNHPVAFCVGCTRQEKARSMSLFEQMDFEVLSSPDTDLVTAFIARNDAFKRQFEHMGIGIGPYI